MVTDSFTSAHFSLCLKDQILSLILKKNPSGHFCFDWGRFDRQLEGLSFFVLCTNSTDGTDTALRLFKDMFCDPSLQCFKYQGHTCPTNLPAGYLEAPEESCWPWNVVVGCILSCDIDRTFVPTHRIVQGVWWGPQSRKHWVSVHL